MADPRRELARLLYQQQAAGAQPPMGGVRQTPLSTPLGRSQQFQTGIKLSQQAGRLGIENPALQARLQEIASGGTGSRSILGKVGGAALKGLEVLDYPRRFIASTLREGIDLMDTDPNTNASFRDLFKQAGDITYGFGKVMPSPTGIKWLDRGIGFIGDVALDPLTYATFGAGKFVGEAGRIALAREVLKTTGDRALATKTATFGRSALYDTPDVLRRVGANQTGIYFLGKRIKVGANQQGWRLPLSGRIAEMSDSALARLRVAASNSRWGKRVARMTTEMDARDARMALKTGQIGPDQGALAIIALSERPGMRATSGMVRQAVESTLVGLANDTDVAATRASLYRIVENPKLLETATDAERRAYDKVTKFFGDRRLELEAEIQKIDPEAKFTGLQDYFSRQISDDAVKYMGNRTLPHVERLRAMFADNVYGTPGAFKARKLKKGSEFFGYVLKQEDIDGGIERLNAIARKYGNIDFDFFETDTVRALQKYTDDYADEMGLFSWYKELDDAGFFTRAERAKIVEKDFIDKDAVKAAQEALKETTKQLDSAVANAAKAVNDAVDSLTQATDTMALDASELWARNVASQEALYRATQELEFARLAYADLWDIDNLRPSDVVGSSIGDMFIARLEAIQDDIARQASRIEELANTAGSAAAIGETIDVATMPALRGELADLQVKLDQIRRTQELLPEFGNVLYERWDDVIAGRVTDPREIEFDAKQAQKLLAEMGKAVGSRGKAAKAAGVTGKFQTYVNGVWDTNPDIADALKYGPLRKTVVAKMSDEQFDNIVLRSFDGGVPIQEMREAAAYALLRDERLYAGVEMPAEIAQRRNELLAALRLSGSEDTLRRRLVSGAAKRAKETPLEVFKKKWNPIYEQAVAYAEDLEGLRLTVKRLRAAIDANPKALNERVDLSEILDKTRSGLTVEKMQDIFAAGGQPTATLREMADLFEDELTRAEAFLYRTQHEMGGVGRSSNLMTGEEVIKQYSRQYSLAKSMDYDQQLLNIEYSGQGQDAIAEALTMYSIESEIYSRFLGAARVLGPVGLEMTERAHSDILNSVGNRYLNGIRSHANAVTQATEVLSSVRQRFSEEMAARAGAETPSQVFKRVFEEEMAGPNGPLISSVLGPEMASLEDPAQVLKAHKKKKGEFRSEIAREFNGRKLRSWFESTFPGEKFDEEAALGVLAAIDGAGKLKSNNVLQWYKGYSKSKTPSYVEARAAVIEILTNDEALEDYMKTLPSIRRQNPERWRESIREYLSRFLQPDYGQLVKSERDGKTWYKISKVSESLNKRLNSMTTEELIELNRATSEVLVAQSKIGKAAGQKTKAWADENLRAWYKTMFPNEVFGVDKALKALKASAEMISDKAGQMRLQPFAPNASVRDIDEWFSAMLGGQLRSGFSGAQEQYTVGVGATRMSRASGTASAAREAEVRPMFTEVEGSLRLRVRKLQKQLRDMQVMTDPGARFSEDAMLRRMELDPEFRSNMQDVISRKVGSSLPNTPAATSRLAEAHLKQLEKRLGNIEQLRKKVQEAKTQVVNAEKEMREAAARASRGAGVRVDPITGETVPTRAAKAVGEDDAALTQARKAASRHRDLMSSVQYAKAKNDRQIVDAIESLAGVQMPAFKNGFVVEPEIPKPKFVDGIETPPEELEQMRRMWASGDASEFKFARDDNGTVITFSDAEWESLFIEPGSSVHRLISDEAGRRMVRLEIAETERLIGVYTRNIDELNARIAKATEGGRRPRGGAAVQVRMMRNRIAEIETELADTKAVARRLKEVLDSTQQDTINSALEKMSVLVHGNEFQGPILTPGYIQTMLNEEGVDMFLAAHKQLEARNNIGLRSSNLDPNEVSKLYKRFIPADVKSQFYARPEVVEARLTGIKRAWEATPEARLMQEVQQLAASAEYQLSVSLQKDAEAAYAALLFARENVEKLKMREQALVKGQTGLTKHMTEAERAIDDKIAVAERKLATLSSPTPDPEAIRDAEINLRRLRDSLGVAYRQNKQRLDAARARLEKLENPVVDSRKLQKAQAEVTRMEEFVLRAQEDLAETQANYNELRRSDPAKAKALQQQYSKRAKRLQDRIANASAGGLKEARERLDELSVPPQAPDEQLIKQLNEDIKELRGKISRGTQRVRDAEKLVESLRNPRVDEARIAAAKADIENLKAQKARMTGMASNAEMSVAGERQRITAMIKDAITLGDEIGLAIKPTTRLALKQARKGTAAEAVATLRKVTQDIQEAQLGGRVVRQADPAEATQAGRAIRDIEESALRYGEEIADTGRRLEEVARVRNSLNEFTEDMRNRITSEEMTLERLESYNNMLVAIRNKELEVADARLVDAEIAYGTAKADSVETMVEMTVRYNNNPAAAWQAVQNEAVFKSTMDDLSARLQKMRSEKPKRPGKEASQAEKKAYALARKEWQNATASRAAEIDSWLQVGRAMMMAQGNLDDKVSQSLAAAHLAAGEFLAASEANMVALRALDDASTPVIKTTFIEPFAKGWKKAMKESGIDVDSLVQIDERRLPGLMADQQVWDMITNVSRINMPGVADDLSRFAGVYTRFFKAYATLSPGFHIRNAISNVFSLFSAGADIGNMTEGLKLYNSQIRHIRNGGTVASWLETVPAAQRQWADVAMRVEMALGGGQIEDALAEFTRAGNVVTENWLLTQSRNVGRKVEGSARFLLAYDSAKQGLELPGAFARTKRYLFDYIGQSELDATMRQLVPFWTWTSRNLPLQLINSVTNPKAYAIYNSFRRNFEDEDGVIVPLWMKQRGAFGIGGSTVLGLDLPQTGIEEQIRELGTREVLNYLNPAIKLPMELAGGESFLTGAPIDNSLWHVLRSAIPPISTVSRLSPTNESARGAGNAWLSWFGVPFQDVTPRQEEGELMRRLMEVQRLGGSQ